MKKIKILLILFFLSFLFLPLNFALANRNLSIYFFWRKGCPHCEKELKLLNFLKNKYPRITIYDYDIYADRQNAALLQRVAESLNVKVDGVPFTVIGGKHFAGFSESITSQEIEDRIDFCLKNQCADTVLEILQENNISKASNQNTANLSQENKTKYKNIIFIFFFVFLFSCIISLTIFFAAKFMRKK